MRFQAFLRTFMKRNKDEDENLGIRKSRQKPKKKKKNSRATIIIYESSKVSKGSDRNEPEKQSETISRTQWVSSPPLPSCETIF